MRHLKDDELVPALSAEFGQELRAAVYARVDTVLSPARMLSPLGTTLSPGRRRGPPRNGSPNARTCRWARR